MKAAVACLAGALSACRPAGAPDPTPSAPAPAIDVLFTGDIHGVTEPCGCTADVLLGGIDRLGRAVADSRAGRPALLVDTGDLLAADVPVSPERLAQESLRKDVLGEAFRVMGYDFVAVGERDLAFGIDGIRSTADRGGFTWLSANLDLADAGATPWKPWAVRRVGGRSIGLVGVIDPSLVPADTGVRARPAGPALATAVAQTREAGAEVVVVLGHMKLRAARRLLKATAGIDFWIRGHDPRRDETARPVGSAYMVEPHEEAQSLGVLRLGPAGPFTRLGLPAAERERLGHRLARVERSMAIADPDLEATLRAQAVELRATLADAPIAPGVEPGAGRFTFRLVPVTPALTPVPALTRLRNGFNRKLKDINLASASPPPRAAEGQASYVGVQECGLCHDEEEAQWKTTEHAHAVPTLVERDKQFDEECIGCHVTGYRQPGGSSIGFLGELEGVQCEACHGPGSLHAEDGTAATALPTAIPETVCRTCHNAKHSPRFEDAAWRPKILGNGHGKAPTPATSP